MTQIQSATSKRHGGRWRGDNVGLACPVCDGEEISVQATRKHRGTIRRHRKCLTCSFFFHTKEVICDVDLVEVEED